VFNDQFHADRLSPKRTSNQRKAHDAREEMPVIAVCENLGTKSRGLAGGVRRGVNNRRPEPPRASAINKVDTPSNR
jgi:hypothetical protein